METLHRNPIVVLDGAACARLVPTLGAAVRDARDRGVADYDFERIVGVIDAVGSAWFMSNRAEDSGHDGRGGQPQLPDSALPADEKVRKEKSTAQAAPLLGVGERQVRRYCKSGVLPSRMRSGGYKLTEEAIYAFREEQQRDRGSPCTRQRPRS